MVGALAVLSLASAMLIRSDVSAQVIFLLISQAIFWMAWLASCFGWGSLFPIPKSTPTVLKLVTRFGLGFGLISILVLLLGLFGVMNRWSAFALIGVGVVLTIVRIVRGQSDLKTWMNGRAGLAWIVLLAAPFLGATILGACVLPGVLWGDEPHGYDVLSYHLLLPREWFEIGRIVPLEHNVFSFFPLNVEMHFLLAMHLNGSPFGGMYLAQFMHATVTLASAGVVYGALADRSRVAAAVGALACASVPWTGMLGAVAYNDGGLMFFGALALVWAWRGAFAPQNDGWLDHVLCWAIGGACGGFAAGCKYPALLTVIAFVPILLIRKPFKPSLMGGAIYVVVAMLCVSPWLIRNTVAVGNPVFPLMAKTLGQGHLDDGQIERFNIAHAPTATEKSIGARLGKFEREVIVEMKSGHRNVNERYGLLCMVFVVGAIGTGVRRDSVSFRIGAYIVLCTVVWLGFTHLQGRFFAPLIPIICWLACLYANRMSLGIVAASVVVGTFAAPTLFQRLTATHRVFEPDGKSVEQFVIDPGYFAFQDMKELRQALPPFDSQKIDPDRKLVFVGNAAIFGYDWAMNQISYRTVFDVPSVSRDLIEAYSKDAPAGSLLIVDPSELARFTRTYRNLPKMPDEIDLDGPAQVIVKP